MGIDKEDVAGSKEATTKNIKKKTLSYLKEKITRSGN